MVELRSRSVRKVLSVVIALSPLLVAATSERCARRPPAAAALSASAPAAAKAATAATAPAAGDPFGEAVRPVLQRRCAPCHEPGGKMYGRLPFDQPGVVASHAGGILRRLKDPEEKAAVERWIASQGAAPATP